MTSEEGKHTPAKSFQRPSLLSRCGNWRCPPLLSHQPGNRGLKTAGERSVVICEFTASGADATQTNERPKDMARLNAERKQHPQLMTSYDTSKEGHG